MPKGRTIEILFTFHNVSINSKAKHRLMKHNRYLHSIMYLLIRKVGGKLLLYQLEFTFHNVSINSPNKLQKLF